MPCGRPSWPRSSPHATGAASSQVAEISPGETAMTCSLAVSWDDRLTSYDFGPGHPLAPVRVELTMALAREFGLLDAPGVAMITPESAPRELLELVHDEVYLEAVRRAGDLAARGEPLDPRSVFFGLGTADDPVFPHMHEAR